VSRRERERERGRTFFFDEKAKKLYIPSLITEVTWHVIHSHVMLENIVTWYATVSVCQIIILITEFTL
jgi:hypothetical protein